MYFNKPQIAVVLSAFDAAESLVGRYFKLSSADQKSNRYDIRTLAHLDAHEVDKGAFAYLCRYLVCKEKDQDNPSGFYFYRVCLQDDRILDAVTRGRNFIKLFPLLLYIATHELIHIVRFGRGESDFNAPPGEKMKEEERVHGITRAILQSRENSGLGLVIECFRNQYKI
ncbi:MAG: hypothetical protein ACE14T_04630 [Syntrophales bacterium]